MTIAGKPCSTCGVTKPLDCFSPDKRAKDGRQPRCRECCNAKKKAAYYADVKESRRKQRAYVAKNIEQVRASNKRSADKNRESRRKKNKLWYERIKQNPEWQKVRAAYRNENREKKREYDKQYATANSGKKVERVRQWVKANPERRRAISASYDARRRIQAADGDPSAVISAWIKATPKICHWCGEKCKRKYHVDHYMPLSKGGRHEVSNLVIACPTCNLRKNAKDPLEFAASMGRLF